MTVIDQKCDQNPDDDKDNFPECVFQVSERTCGNVSSPEFSKDVDDAFIMPT
jgi:hypothetical protein